MSDPAASGADPRSVTPVDSDQAFTSLLERLNNEWRISGMPPPPSLKKQLVYKIRQVLGKFLATQETFNAGVVQFVNTASGPLLSALDEVGRYRDALAARERRMDAEIARLRAEQDELRTTLATLRQVTQDLTRDAARRTSAPAAPESGAAAPVAAAPSTHSGTSSEALGQKYVGFEDQFRGAPETIRARLMEYVPVFAGQADVLDIGCGRGEFLALLGEHGVTAKGIDVNESMVEVCRGKGLDATRADALSYLRQQPQGSLGGLMAAQVVEHLDPSYLTALLDAAFDALRPGAPIVLETINPACWFAFFESYIRDITHVRPLHPDTLSFLLVASGFGRVDVRYRSPYPEHDKLQTVAASGPLGDAAGVLNANVQKINRLLFTHLDYAAIARRS
jgi:O-antigen chain-terminating methyltransferase